MQEQAIPEQELAPAHRSLGSLTMGHPEYTAPLRVDLTPKPRVGLPSAYFGLFPEQEVSIPEAAEKLATGLASLETDGPVDSLKIGYLALLARNLATVLN